MHQLVPVPTHWLDVLLVWWKVLWQGPRSPGTRSDEMQHVLPTLWLDFSILCLDQAGNSCGWLYCQMVIFNFLGNYWFYWSLPRKVCTASDGLFFMCHEDASWGRVAVAGNWRPFLAPGIRMWCQHLPATPHAACKTSLCLCLCISVRRLAAARRPPPGNHTPVWNYDSE